MDVCGNVAPLYDLSMIEIVSGGPPMTDYKKQKITPPLLEPSTSSAVSETAARTLRLLASASRKGCFLDYNALLPHGAPLHNNVLTKM